jgi:O-antigen/teichoic acid export membrane protein
VAAALGVSSVQTGNAAIAVGAAVALILVVVQLFQVELPGAARRVAAGHHVLVRDRATRLALGSVGVAAAIALAGVLAGPPLIDWLLGDRFAEAGDALGPALAAVPLAPVAALGVNHALLAGRPNVRIALSVVGATAFGLAAVLLLSSGSDAYDVALATLAGAVGASVAATVYARPPVALTLAGAGAAGLVWIVGALVT